MLINKSKLQIAMANKCIDPVDLAEKAGIAYATIKRATLKDGAKPSTVGKIAKALEVPVEDLLEKEA